MRFLTLASLSLATWMFLGCGGSVEPEVTSDGEDSATSSDGGGSIDGGGSSDGSVTPPGEDGSVTPPLEDGGVSPPPPADGSTGPGGIACGMSTCNAATQDCCAGTGGAKCVTKGTCTGGATLSCTDPSVCATGEVCCASGGGGGGGGGAGAKCSKTCTGAVLCSTNADCKAPQTCQPAFGGVKTCRNAGPGGGMDGGFGGFDASGFFDAKAGG